MTNWNEPGKFILCSISKQTYGADSMGDRCLGYISLTPIRLNLNYSVTSKAFVTVQRICEMNPSNMDFTRGTSGWGFIGESAGLIIPWNFPCYFHMWWYINSVRSRINMDNSFPHMRHQWRWGKGGKVRKTQVSTCQCVAGPRVQVILPRFELSLRWRPHTRKIGQYRCTVTCRHTAEHG